MSRRRRDYDSERDYEREYGSGNNVIMEGPKDVLGCQGCAGMFLIAGGGLICLMCFLFCGCMTLGTIKNISDGQQQSQPSDVSRQQ